MRTNSSSALIFLCSNLTDLLLLGRFALPLDFGDGMEAQLHLVMDIVRDQRHFLDHLLLEIKPVEGVLQFVVQFLEFAGRLVAGGGLFRRASCQRAYCSSTCWSSARTCLSSLRNSFQMVLPPLDLLVHDDPVKAFLGRLGNEFFGQGDVLLAGEAEAVNDAFDLVLRLFDALGDFDLLLARQQRDLAHLLEVHPHRVIQNVQTPLVFVFLRLRLLDAVHFGLVNDLDLQDAQLAVKIVQFLGRNDRVGQGVVDVGVSQVALLLGQADQFLDFLGQVHPGIFERLVAIRRRNLQPGLDLALPSRLRRGRGFARRGDRAGQAFFAVRWEEGLAFLAADFACGFTIVF